MNFIYTFRRHPCKIKCRERTFLYLFYLITISRSRCGSLIFPQSMFFLLIKGVSNDRRVSSPFRTFGVALTQITFRNVFRSFRARGKYDNRRLEAAISCSLRILVTRSRRLSYRLGPDYPDCLIIGSAFKEPHRSRFPPLSLASHPRVPSSRFAFAKSISFSRFPRRGLHLAAVHLDRYGPVMEALSSQTTDPSFQKTKLHSPMTLVHRGGFIVRNSVQ